MSTIFACNSMPMNYSKNLVFEYDIVESRGERNTINKREDVLQLQANSQDWNRNLTQSLSRFHAQYLLMQSLGPVPIPVSLQLGPPWTEGRTTHQPSYHSP